MSKYTFSVVLSFKTTEYNSLQSGDVVVCCADAYNKADPDAVAVYYGNTLIGYACNSPETVIPETMSGKRLRKLIDNPKVKKTVAILRKEDPFTNRKGELQRRFVAEAYFIPVRQKTESATFKVGGLKSVHTKLSQLLGEIAARKDAGNDVDIPIEVRKVPNGIFVFRPGDGDTASCGEIKDKNVEDLINASSSKTLKGRAIDGAGKEYTIVVDTAETRISRLYPFIDAAVERCVGQTAEIESRANVMIDGSVPDPVMQRVLDQMPTLDEPVVAPETPYSQKNGTNLSDLLSYMLLGKTVQLVGEKGSGKNTLVETACWLLNRPLCRVQGSSELDKLDILGSPSLKDGCTEFELSSMLKTLRDDGIVVIDEANTVRPDVMVMLHSLTDGARSVNVPGYGLVTMGPHASIIYTLNEDYIGTGEMNAATVDRGPRLFIEQEKDMGGLLKRAVPDAKAEDISICVKIAESMRKAVRESGTLTAEDLTVRGYIDALKVAQFIPLKRALLHNVAYKAQNEIERTAMSEIIRSYIA